MIRLAHPSGQTASSRNASSTPGEMYGRVFWLGYAANMSVMIGASLLYRYADFIRYLGGTEGRLGLIVGVGMFGSLAMRVFQGVAIDRYGARRVWHWSLVGLALCAIAHLFIVNLHGPEIYLARIMFMSCIAGTFGASITYVSLRAPEDRLAEMIGVLGSSGFIGMIVGPVIGDLLFAGGRITRPRLDMMFLIAAALVVVALFCAVLATEGDVRPVRRRKIPPPWKLLGRYHPGPMLLIAGAMGLGLGLPTNFLPMFTAQAGIGQIKTFFIVYAITAFSLRILARRMPDQLGVRPTMLFGIWCLAASMLLYLVVRSQWMLAIPAITCGVGHAFLYPSVMAGATTSFPSRYRGLATTMVLAMMDVGNMIGQPAVGGIVELAGRAGLPAYPTMFVSMFVCLSLVAVYYGRATRSRAAAAPVAVPIPLAEPVELAQGVPSLARVDVLGAVAPAAALAPITVEPTPAAPIEPTNPTLS